MYTIQVLKRPKVFGLGDHFAVQMPGGLMYEFGPTSAITQTNLQKFSKGRPVTLVSVHHTWQPEQAFFRLQEVLLDAAQYRVVDWNCESFANYIATGKKESKQGTFVGVSIAALIGYALLAAK
jgi:hypothetical protein